MTLGSELKALNAMNNLRVCLTLTTLGHERRALDAMNNSRLWMISMAHDPLTSTSRCYEQLKVVDHMNSSWL